MDKQVGLYSKNIMPYMGVENEQMVQFKTSAGIRRFQVWTYQAYNVFGLIGCECNGIAVGDVDSRRILLDEEAKQDSGWFGASHKQLARFWEIARMTWEQFQEFANSHPR